MIAFINGLNISKGSLAVDGTKKVLSLFYIVTPLSLFIFIEHIISIQKHYSFKIFTILF